MINYGKSKTAQRSGPPTFVENMLQSAQEKTEVHPQTRHDHVDMDTLEKTMANLKKGIVRR